MKLKTVAIVLMLTLGVVGCGKSTDTSLYKENTTEQTESVEDTESVEAEEKSEGIVAKGTITKEDVMNAPESPAEDFTYEKSNEGEVYIEDYVGDDDIIVIPGKIDGGDVISVSQGMFEEDRITARAVRFPDSVEFIRRYTFYDNKNIEIVILGSGVKEIKDYAFWKASNLRELILPEGLEKIGLAAMDLTAIETLKVPSSVVDLGDMAITEMTVIGEPGSAIEEYAEEAYKVEFQAKSEDTETE